MNNPVFVSQTDFAVLQGWAKSYVTQLKQAGRLVMDDAGKRVDVAASLSRIEATRSPDKSGVSDHHANARGQEGASAAGEDEDAPVDRRDYQDARARREAANADIAEMEAKQRAGSLVEVAQVEAALADALTTLRTALESMGALMAPQLAAEMDEREIRQLVDDHVHGALQDVANRFAAMSRAGEAH